MDFRTVVMSEQYKLRGPRRTEGDHDVRDARVTGRAERAGRAGASTTRLPPAWGARGGRGRDSGGGHRRRRVLRHAAQGPQASSLSGPSHGPATEAHQPPLPRLQTDAANRAAAELEAEHAMAAMPVYANARVSDQQGVPELNEHWLSQVQPVDNTVVRSSWWTVSGPTPSLVALWYAQPRPVGLPRRRHRRRPGRRGPGGSMRSTTPSRGTTSCLHQGRRWRLQTTRTAEGVGIRATVDSVWSPARPLASYVQDVTSIDVTWTRRRFGRHVSTTRR